MKRRDMLKSAAVIAALPTAAFAHDPLLDAIAAYKVGCSEYLLVPEAELLKDEDAWVENTYGAPMRVLSEWNAPAQTKAGHSKRSRSSRANG